MEILRAYIAILGVVAIVIAVLSILMQSQPEKITLSESGYWGASSNLKGGLAPRDDETIYKFLVEYKNSTIDFLKKQLEFSKAYPPLEKAGFHYGTNLKYLSHVIRYWKENFDFQKSESILNSFEHYSTQIEGLKIHFMRSAPKRTISTVKVYPLLLVHGWPGSFIEFVKIAPMLSENRNGTAFDVIMPSIPGYGLSEAPQVSGLDVLVTARIFRKLMDRLGYSQFYMQGGDWGSAITTAMAVLYPDRLRGIHLNMLYKSVEGVKSLIRILLFAWFPKYLGDGTLPPCMPVPFKPYLMRMLSETGYMHLQATRPDTIGIALLNSPAGLAAYILEKFAVWSGNFKHLEDGGLDRHFELDDVLTNIMVYYATGSIVSSVRFYRENIFSENVTKLNNQEVSVPTGYTVFPNELTCVPRFLAKDVYVNLATFTYQHKGGHFAAYQEPTLLHEDIRNFVGKVEASCCSSPPATRKFFFSEIDALRL